MDVARKSIVTETAGRFGVEPGPLEETRRATVLPGKRGLEQFAAFLLVANKYGLDPVTKRDLWSEFAKRTNLGLTPCYRTTPIPEIVSATTGTRTLSSLCDASETALATAKVATAEVIERIRGNAAIIDAAGLDHPFRIYSCPYEGSPRVNVRRAKKSTKKVP